jgi:hypothetical protein
MSPESEPPNPETIHTEIAFIEGDIKFSGLRGSIQPPSVTVVAESGDRKTMSNVKAGGHYCLFVRPGKWAVRAETEAVVSESKSVTLGPGDHAQIDFVFGKTG